MPYIENGRVVERRSGMRIQSISDFFWGFLNAIYAFFHTMLSPQAASDLAGNNYRGPFGGPARRGPFGGGGGGSGPRRGPNVQGIRRPEVMDAPPMGGGC
mmetsp:Transcript_41385/g.110748  ORF Transcript_41385/g.110748 Transcript_41385/m.110748 type:complete len:100 (-) Transcript_41385:267-566(-)